MLHRHRRAIPTPDPVPVDPVDNIRSALRDIGHTGINDPRRIGGILDSYDITVGDLVAIVDTGGNNGQG